jgi:hypothetical protein
MTAKGAHKSAVRYGVRPLQDPAICSARPGGENPEFGRGGQRYRGEGATSAQEC